MEETLFYITLLSIGVILYLTYPKNGTLKIFKSTVFVKNVLFLLSLFLAGFIAYLYNIRYLTEQKLFLTATFSSLIAFFTLLPSLSFEHKGQTKTYYSLAENKHTRNTMMIIGLVLIIFLVIFSFYYKQELSRFWAFVL